jgi:hypothetical protein
MFQVDKITANTTFPKANVTNNNTFELHFGSGGWQDQALANDKSDDAWWFAEHVFEELVSGECCV